MSIYSICTLVVAVALPYYNTFKDFVLIKRTAIIIIVAFALIYNCARAFYIIGYLLTYLVLLMVPVILILAITLSLYILINVANSTANHPIFIVRAVTFVWRLLIQLLILYLVINLYRSLYIPDIMNTIVQLINWMYKSVETMVDTILIFSLTKLSWLPRYEIFTNYSTELTNTIGISTTEWFGILGTQPSYQVTFSTLCITLLILTVTLSLTNHLYTESYHSPLFYKLTGFFISRILLTLGIYSTMFYIIFMYHGVLPAQAVSLIQIITGHLNLYVLFFLLFAIADLLIWGVIYRNIKNPVIKNLWLVQNIINIIKTSEHTLSLRFYVTCLKSNTYIIALLTCLHKVEQFLTTSHPIGGAWFNFLTPTGFTNWAGRIFEWFSKYNMSEVLEFYAWRQVVMATGVAIFSTIIPTVLANSGFYFFEHWPATYEFFTHHLSYLFEPYYPAGYPRFHEIPPHLLQFRTSGTRYLLDVPDLWHIDIKDHWGFDNKRVWYTLEYAAQHNITLQPYNIWYNDYLLECVRNHNLRHNNIQGVINRMARADGIDPASVGAPKIYLLIKIIFIAAASLATGTSFNRFAETVTQN